MTTTTKIARNKLMKLAKAEKLVEVSSGLPVNVIASKADRKSDHFDVFDSDFMSGSGACWQDEAGVITLYVHSNCSHRFRIKEV